MSKELVKFKIMKEDDGHTINAYYWHRIFWFVGLWIPYGSASSSHPIDTFHINTESVAECLYDNFIKNTNL